MRDGWEKKQGRGAWIVGAGARLVAGDGPVLPNSGAGALALPDGAGMVLEDVEGLGVPWSAWVRLCWAGA